MASMSVLSNMVCPLCPLIRKYDNLTDYLKHVVLFHSHQPNFSITCGIGGCLRIFKNIRTFRNHISARHSGTDYLDSSRFESTNVEGNCHGNSCSDIETIDESEDIAADAVQCYKGDRKTMLKRSSALFLLKLKEKQKLTQVTLQSIVEGVTSLFHDHLDSIRAEVDSKLKDVGESLPIDDIFEQEEFRRPFGGLESQHQQITFFKSHFNFVVSVVQSACNMHLYYPFFKCRILFV